MRVIFWIVAAVALCVVAPVNAQVPPGAQQAMDVVKSIEPKVLSESDMKRFIATAKEFDEKDVDFDTGNEGNVPTREEMLEMARSNDQAMSILRSHGFEPEEYYDVTMNVMLAMGASEMQKNKAEIDEAMAQLELMKSQIPPAQYEMLAEQVLGVQTAFAKAPASNIALVEKYKPELEKLGN